MQSPAIDPYHLANPAEVCIASVALKVSAARASLNLVATTLLRTLLRGLCDHFHTLLLVLCPLEVLLLFTVQKPRCKVSLAVLLAFSSVVDPAEMLT
jgi:hypothetical protein